MPDEPIESLLSRLEPQLRRLASRSSCPEVRAHAASTNRRRKRAGPDLKAIRDEADDLFNDLYLRLTAHPVPPHANAESYAVESFKNLIRDRERTCNRRAARDVEFMRARLEARSDRVDEVAIQHDLRRHIKRALRQANLRSDHGCALWAWLRDSLDEFAARRGITRKTAGVWAWRARQSLRPYLDTSESLARKIAVFTEIC